MTTTRTLCTMRLSISETNSIPPFGEGFLFERGFMLKLEIIKRTDPRLLENMKNHYSKPKGFVGRNICYAVLFDNLYYGSIVGGSATLHLPNRHEFFNSDKSMLNNIVNNIFFHIEKNNGHYPVRNFGEKILKEFRNKVSKDWADKYNDTVLGFETLVELPRTGEVYLRDGWTKVGETKGYTCKRVAGNGTDSWSGKRIWNKNELRPKLVFCRKEQV